MITPVRRRLAVPLLAGLVALCAAAPAVAQDAEARLATMDATEWTLVALQLAESLDSPVAQIRQEALQQITFFATYHSEHVDLRAAIPALLSIYESRAAEGERIQALMALRAVGDGATMDYLLTAAERERSPRVHQLTLAAVADYRGGQ